MRTTLTTNSHFDLSQPVITEPNLLEAEFRTGMREVDELRLELSPVSIRDQLNPTTYDEIRSVQIIATVGWEEHYASRKATSAIIYVFGITQASHLLVVTMSN